MPPTSGRSNTAPLLYQVEPADLHAHLYRITLSIPRPQADQRVTLPVWIPGSYLVREFSKNLQMLRARQGRRQITPQQLDKCSWQIACDPQQALELSYEVYAFDNSVRTAWLDATRGFFNGTSLCLRVEGQSEAPHELTLLPGDSPAAWQVATGLSALKVDRRGFGRYRASHYDELVDCPFELGAFWRGDFKAAGVPHRFVIAGAPPSFDGTRLLADAQRICETAIRFWHAGGKSTGRSGKPPFARYVFMLNATDDGYGGLEHHNSTALICARRDLPRTEAKVGEGYTTLLGLISHEYFHSWNVKRLRPAAFARYDYSRENYTDLLWFFEGFTSYFDDLLLRRAGLLDDAGYLRLLNKSVNQLQQTPGRLVQSVAQASLDAWVKYYRVDENTPNATVSYYGKGALVALCLDLTLRAECPHSLDDVMRALWVRCKAGPMAESDLLAVLQELSGRSWARELNRWVHSTAELPLRELLERHGVGIHEEPAQLAQRLGLRVGETGGSIHIKTVLRGGAGERAGLAAGDEWLGVELGGGKTHSGWRLNKLDDLLLYAGGEVRVRALVARDKQLLTLPLQLPPSVSTWRLSVRAKEQLADWLGA
ncbi:MAG: peptidase M61 [Hylemonella sp.]|nr:peptidase M61 [Hylemonella sp.]